MKHVVFDLDGVLWRGSTPLEGAATSLADLARAGVALVFATNNSTRTPEMVANKIEKMTGFVTNPDSVVTSAMAAASMLTPHDSPVYVVGADALTEAVSNEGLSTTDDPTLARSVVVGLDRGFAYREMASAATAIRTGARFIATNVDPTFPTAEGFDPGAGAIVAAIATASGSSPEVAGKPHPPMVELLRARGVGSAWVIGDRMDTDIALAHHSGWESILVLTGVAGRDDPANVDADWIVDDVRKAADLVLSASEES